MTEKQNPISASKADDGFDYEMECAKELGPTAVADLRNRREAEGQPAIAVVSAEEALMVWALYENGHLASGQSSALPYGGGSNWPRRSASDWVHANSEMMHVARAVECVKGFAKAREALRLVHVTGMPLSTLTRAQLAAYDEFVRQLEARLSRRPIEYRAVASERPDLAAVAERLRNMLRRKERQRGYARRASGEVETT